ncbi:MAG: right-handed parallel beta-helix repeat-containing protein, partial [Thermoplasmatales archaeon]
MKNYKIWKKSLVFGVLALFVGMSAIPSTGITVEEKPSLPASSGNILYVGGSGPGNYSTIQAAINVANNGDTIFVYNGTYNENVKVNKTINLTGEGKDITIIYGIDELDDAVKITADLANVSEFTIKNGGINSAGIRVQADQCSISDTIIIDNQEKGLWIDNSENNTILDNALSDNSHGIYVDNSDNNMISNNNVSDNRNNGIYGVRSNNNDIVNNLVNSNDLIGIYLIQDCDNNEISNNTVKSNEKGGIRLYKSDDNIISNNAVSKNGGPTYDGGIVFYYSNNNNIFANSVNSNS